MKVNKNIIIRLKIYIYIVFFLLQMPSHLLALQHDFNFSNSRSLFLFPGNFKVDFNNSILNSQQLIEVNFSPVLLVNQFYMAFEFPFQINIGKTGLYNDFAYLHPNNYLQFIHSIGYSTPDQSVFFKIGSFEDVSLGTGFILHHFRNDLFLPQVRNLGLQLFLKYPFLDFHLISANITNFSLIGMDFNIKPFMFAKKPLNNAFSKMTLGLSFVCDMDNYAQIYSGDNIIYMGSYNPLSTPIYTLGVNTTLPFFENASVNLGMQFEYAYMNYHNRNNFFGKFYLNKENYSFEAGVAYLNNGFLLNFFSPLYLQSEIRKSRYKEFDGIKNAIGWYMQHEVKLFDNKVHTYFEIYGQSDNSLSYHFYFDLEPFLLKTLSINLGYIKEDSHTLKESFDPTKSLDKSLIYGSISYSFAQNTRIKILYSKNFKSNYVDNSIVNNHYLSLEVSFFF